MSGLHAYFRSTRKPTKRGIMAYFQRADQADREQLSSGSQGVDTEVSNDVVMIDAEVMVISDTEADETNLAGAQSVGTQMSTSASVYGTDEFFLRECVHKQLYLVPSMPVELSVYQHPAEVQAAQCLKDGVARWASLSVIMDALPCDPKPRWQSTCLPVGAKEAKTFMTGSMGARSTWRSDKTHEAVSSCDQAAGSDNCQY